MAVFCSSRGQAAVEFALATPVFFVLTVGVIDAGRAFYSYNNAAHAAREGARFAAVQGGSQNAGFNWVNPDRGNAPGVYGLHTSYPIGDYLVTESDGRIRAVGIVGTVANAAKGLNLDDLKVTIAAPGPTGPSPDSPVQVRLDYAFHPGTSLLFTSRPITLTASSTMIIE